MTVRRDKAWLAGATPDEIVAAQSNGELARLLGATPEDIAAQQAARAVAQLFSGGTARTGE